MNKFKSGISFLGLTFAFVLINEAIGTAVLANEVERLSNSGPIAHNATDLLPQGNSSVVDNTSVSYNFAKKADSLDRGKLSVSQLNNFNQFCEEYPLKSNCHKIDFDLNKNTIFSYHVSTSANVLHQKNSSC